MSIEQPSQEVDPTSNRVGSKVKQTRECNYCDQIAEYVTTIQEEAQEGLIVYKYYVCIKHKNVDHHSEAGIKLWAKNN